MVFQRTRFDKRGKRLRCGLSGPIVTSTVPDGTELPGGKGYSFIWPGYIGMCDPKGYGFSAVLVINRVSIVFDFGHFVHNKIGYGFCTLALLWIPFF